MLRIDSFGAMPYDLLGRHATFGGAGETTCASQSGGFREMFPIMHWKPNLPDVFLGISLGVTAVEAALSRFAIIKARYRAHDSFASMGMQIGNIAMNLGMAGACSPDFLRRTKYAFSRFRPVRRGPGWRADGQGLTSKSIRAAWDARGSLSS